MDDISAYEIPTDAEISAIETELKFSFPVAFKDFLRSGGDVKNVVYEPDLVLPGIDRLYLIKVANDAWASYGISGEWLPFIEDNGDFFRLSTSGEVLHWSPDGITKERWSSFKDWFQQCCVARR